jgi:hypothetical protein
MRVIRRGAIGYVDLYSFRVRDGKAVDVREVRYSSSGRSSSSGKSSSSGRSSSSGSYGNRYWESYDVEYYDDPDDFADDWADDFAIAQLQPATAPDALFDSSLAESLAPTVTYDDIAQYLIETGVTIEELEDYETDY